MKCLALALCLLFVGACERVPEEVLVTHHDALERERAMRWALETATPDTPPEHLEKLRQQYVVDALRAHELRAHVQDLLEREIEERAATRSSRSKERIAQLSSATSTSRQWENLGSSSWRVAAPNLSFDTGIGESSMRALASTPRHRRGAERLTRPLFSVSSSLAAEEYGWVIVFPTNYGTRSR